MICMFVSKGCNAWNITRVNDYESSFYFKLQSYRNKHNSRTLLNVLLNEVCKHLNGVSPKLISKIFYLCQNHLRSSNVFLWVIYVTNFYEILLFTKQTSYNKHCFPKLKTVYQYKFLRIKSILGTGIDVSIKFAQSTMPL